MKNIDKIRQMDADELAFVLMCPYEGQEKIDRDADCSSGKCIKCVKDWLGKEAKNDDV